MSYDSAFPAVDSTTTRQLASQTPGNVNVSSITRSIRDAEVNNLYQALNTADMNSQSALTYGMYLSRNNTIANIATDLTEENKKVVGGLKDTVTRQYEINEWQAQNKLDTLFFLQTSFLFFVLVVILVLLQKFEVINMMSVYIVTGVGLLILIGILWNRASYTSRSRDKRHWNRRFIGLDQDLSAKNQCAL
jgi:hypothetical protein